jgi:methanogenic corrinoid protein MtbC1
VRQALTEKILMEGLISTMTEVGRMFENGEFYVPEMLISARAMKGGLALLRLELAAAKIQAIGKWLSAPSRATCTISARTWLR